MQYDVLVLGSGPAGFYCALTCARLGRKTILVERDRLGGTGFRWGCLPVKMMLDRVRSVVGAEEDRIDTAASLIPDTALRIQEVETRVRRRLTAAGVEVVRGQGRLLAPDRFGLGKRIVSASRIAIATGTEAAGWPGVPLEEEFLLSHRDVLGLSDIPKDLLILGGDVEGIEFACLFARLGIRVTVIEKEGRILPGTDPDLSEPVRQDLVDRGVVFKTGAEASGLEAGATVSLKDGSALRAERILVTGLRRPNFPQGLEEIGVEKDGQKIAVNADLRTSCDTIYAVGDINGITGMAHAAIQQGVATARRMAGLESVSKTAASFPPYPRAIYTVPEIAGAGYQEIELKERGIPYRCLKYRLADTWRGFSKGIEKGFTKVLAGENDRILGIWICGPDASEQASLFGPLLAGGLSLDGLRDGLILHPTLGEAALEAILGGD